VPAARLLYRVIEQSWWQDRTPPSS